MLSSEPLSEQPKTPLSSLRSQHSPPDFLSPPDTHFYVFDTWNELTSAQIATMSPDETREMLLKAVAHITMLRQTLRLERAGAAHHTLQHKLLTHEMHEASQRYSVEINLIRQEVDRLLYELTLPSNTFLTYQRHYRNIKRRLRKTLSLLNLKKMQEKNSSHFSSNHVAQAQKNNEPCIFNQQNLEKHSPKITQHNLMSPIIFHSIDSTQQKNHNTIKEADTQQLSKTLLKKKSFKRNHLNAKRRYRHRSLQPVLISPNTSPQL